MISPSVVITTKSSAYGNLSVSALKVVPLHKYCDIAQLVAASRSFSLFLLRTTSSSSRVGPQGPVETTFAGLPSFGLPTCLLLTRFCCSIFFGNIFCHHFVLLVSIVTYLIPVLITQNFS
jgi:hypothetical protein